jgi:hypothetical protein
LVVPTLMTAVPFRGRLWFQWCLYNFAQASDAESRASGDEESMSRDK